MTQTVREMTRLKRRARWELLRSGGLPLEGSSSASELLYLVQTVRRTNARLVGEIGFNAGFSSYTVLASCPQAKVVSFDLCEHAVSRAAKRLMDRKFPGRHTLICGDSRETVPSFAAENPDVRFDVAFIDGGHEYEVAKADIDNMRALCSPDTAVIMDDLTPWQSWGKGPHQAWGEAIEAGAVSQTEMFKDGEPVDVLEPPGVRAWALGRYT
jgi:predicted O-methyltransferase YrrM